MKQTSDRLIIQPVPIIIRPSAGRETVYRSSVIFPGGVGKMYEKLDIANDPTPATPVQVYGLKGKGSFAQMLRRLDRADIDQFFLAQSQVPMFVAEHPEWLYEGGGTFFPFRVDHDRYIASVYHHDNDEDDLVGWKIDGYEFSLTGGVRSSLQNDGRRLVVPVKKRK